VALQQQQLEPLAQGTFEDAPIENKFLREWMANGEVVTVVDPSPSELRDIERLIELGQASVAHTSGTNVCTIGGQAKKLDTFVAGKLFAAQLRTRLNAPVRAARRINGSSGRPGARRSTSRTSSRDGPSDPSEPEPPRPRLTLVQRRAVFTFAHISVEVRS
jgi:hypothetical protein